MDAVIAALRIVRDRYKAIAAAMLPIAVGLAVVALIASKGVVDAAKNAASSLKDMPGGDGGIVNDLFPGFHLTMLGIGLSRHGVILLVAALLGLAVFSIGFVVVARYMAGEGEGLAPMDAVKGAIPSAIKVGAVLAVPLVLYMLLDLVMGTYKLGFNSIMLLIFFLVTSAWVGVTGWVAVKQVQDESAFAGMELLEEIKGGNYQVLIPPAITGLVVMAALWFIDKIVVEVLPNDWFTGSSFSVGLFLGIVVILLPMLVALPFLVIAGAVVAGHDIEAAPADPTPVTPAAPTT